MTPRVHRPLQAIDELERQRAECMAEYRRFAAEATGKMAQMEARVAELDAQIFELARRPAAPLRLPDVSSPSENASVARQTKTKAPAPARVVPKSMDRGPAVPRQMHTSHPFPRRVQELHRSVKEFAALEGVGYGTMKSWYWPPGRYGRPIPANFAKKYAAAPYFVPESAWPSGVAEEEYRPRRRRRKRLSGGIT